MKKRICTLVISALLLGVASLAWYRTQLASHRVFLNGTIITVDPENRIVQALSVRDGLIEALGSNTDIQALINNKTQVTDLQGNTLLPGFIDAHSHYPSTGLTQVSVDMSPPPIGTTESIGDIQSSLKAALERSDSDQWLLGLGYDDSLLKEDRHPTVDELDAVSTDRPIYLWHSSGHMGVANSVGLRKLGIDKNARSDASGVIERNPRGRLTGLLKESAAPAMSRFAKDFSLLDYYRIVRAANKEYLRHGVTTAQSGAANASLTRALQWLAKLRLLPLRMVVLPRYDPPQVPPHLNKNSNSDWLHIGPVKLFADGSPQGYTAYLSEPYFTPSPSGYPDYRGFPAMSLAVLSARVEKLHAAGYQLAIHGNGDAAIDNIIQAFDHAQQKNRQRDPRMIVMHAQMARKDQLEKMSTLGMTPSFFNTHTYYWGDIHYRKTMGPGRAANMSPTADAAHLGLRFSLHSDAPVTPINPMQLIWSAVHRLSVSGRIIGAHQRISLMQAIRAVTIDAAWQVFLEESRGSLEKGKLADLVILSGNLLNPTNDIRQMRVLETIVGGRSRYKR